MPTINIRWSDNTAELTKHLKEGTGQIEATKAAVDKMVQSLSGDKLLAAAHKYTAAVNQIGGAEKLTSAEKARINDLLTKAIEKYTALGRVAPKAMTDLASATKSTATSTDGFVGGLTKANQVLGFFGAALSVGAVINFGRSLLNTADQLVKVADRTGLTTTEVQKLQYIAEQSGNSLDNMTRAISKLQAGLAGGDKGVVNAVKDLGLNFKELRAASPFEQMEMVASAMQKIEDPTARAKLAMQLFGRAGAEILPTLISDFSALGDAAPVMSDKTTRALDQAGDSLNRFGHQVKVFAAELYNSLGRLFDQMFLWFYKLQAGFATMLADLIEKAQKIPGVAKLMGVLGVSTESLREQARNYTEVAKAQAFQLNHVEKEVRKTVAPVMELTSATDDGAAASKKAAAEAKRLAEAQKELDAKYRALVFPMRDVMFLQQDINAAIRQTAVGAAPLLYAKALPLTTLALKDVGREAQVTIKHTSQLGKTIKNDLIKVLESVPQTVANALTGGGGIVGAFQAIGSQIGSVIGEGIGKSIASLGRLGGPIGAAIGSLAGPSIGWLAGKFGGPSELEIRFQKIKEKWEENVKLFKDTDSLRQAFIKIEGGIEALSVRAQVAGVDLKAMLDASTPEEYRKAIDELNDALKFQDDAMKLLDDTVKKYGFSIEQLGPKFAKQKLDDQARELFQDYQVLNAGGLDHVAILEKMAPALNQLVKDYKKAGIDIPLEMKPILQSLADQGELVDENGDKLTDLSKLKFAETLDSKFQTLIDTIGRLVLAIERGLNPALLNVPKVPNPFEDADKWLPGTERPDEVNTGGGGSSAPEVPADFGATGGLITKHGIQHFATGGFVRPVLQRTLYAPRGADTVPIMASPGELLLNKSQQDVIADVLRGALTSASGTQSEAIVAELRALRADVVSLQRATVIQMDGREIARGLNRVLDNGGVVRTEMRETLGVV